MANYEPEYINLKGNQKERGRFELAFGQIGASYFVGGILGALGGLFVGHREAKHLSLSGRLRRTHVLNHVLKCGGSWGQTAGTLALVYSMATVGIILQRGHDDDFTTASAAALTGLLHQAPGLKKSLLGGLFGVGAVCPVILWNHGHELKEFMKRFKSTPQYTNALKTFNLDEEELFDSQPIEMDSSSFDNDKIF